MKAIYCAAPGKLEIRDADAPANRPGWVRVAVRHIGICGTDYHIFEGNFPFFEYPRIIGHELSGVVSDANGVPGFAAGDPVVINPYLTCGQCPACLEGKTNCCETLKVVGVHADGGMADEIVMPAANLYKADGLSLRDAAMVEFLAIGAHAVQRAEVKPGNRALVVGSGPIGLGVAYFAKIAGAEVTVVDAAPDKIEATRALGFDTFAVSETESEAFNEVKRTGFDTVFDATGSIKAMNASIFHTCNGGNYTLVGVIKGDLVFPDSEFHRREITLRASRNAQKRDFDHVIDSIRKGLVPTDRLATHSTNFENVPVDMAGWAHSRVGLIKAIVNM
ncbi:MAG TPA: zinc-binding alcohol dehydrogenase family protein [Devosia sp.]|nr:zinc-binding alcohol dehydrogenase family protein [Devosia sp.]